MRKAWKGNFRGWVNQGWKPPLMGLNAWSQPSYQCHEIVNHFLLARFISSMTGMRKSFDRILIQNVTIELKEQTVLGNRRKQRHS
jgi:hypothetical protein